MCVCFTHVQGIKSATPLLLLDSFSPTSSMVIDYMHCVLLGVTKALLQRWVDPGNRGMSFFIGDQVDYVDRLHCYRHTLISCMFILSD